MNPLPTRFGLHPKLVSKAVFPFHERLMKRPTLSYLGFLERTQWLTRAEIEALQMVRLKALLRTAQAHSPWHAERIARSGIDLGETSALTADDLRRLPTMDKLDATVHRDRLVWRDAPGGVFQYNTGGSSGQPLIFFYGRTRQASDAAARIRARRWWGVEPGDREVYLWGAPVELNKTDRIKTVRDRLLNQLVLNAFEMSVNAMDSYIEAIRAFRPKCIYGYASSVALLAARVQDRAVRIRLPGLGLVCTTGEPLYPHQRRLIQEAFGVPVASEYGSRDIGFTAHEAPGGQMLLVSESILLEVLDGEGNPVMPGELGEAVMTGLCSEAQPFIRYRTGDVVRLSEERCAAERGLHVIGEVLGRSTDFVVRSDGTIMHALAVIYVIRAVEGIQEFKFIQHTVDAVEIRVVPDTRWREESREQIIRGMRARLGAEVRVDLHVVDEISPDASGKFRYVVSHVPLQNGLGGALGLNAIEPRETRK